MPSEAICKKTNRDLHSFEKDLGRRDWQAWGEETGRFGAKRLAGLGRRDWQAWDEETGRLGAKRLVGLGRRDWQAWGKETGRLGAKRLAGLGRRDWQAWGKETGRLGSSGLKNNTLKRLMHLMFVFLGPRQHQDLTRHVS